MNFGALNRPIAPYITHWLTKIGYQGMSRLFMKRFCVPTVHSIVPRSHTKEANYTLIYKGLKAE